MRQIVLCNAETELDFYIEGVFSYELFGQTFWITTTHLSMLVVTLVLIGLAYAVNRSMRHAKEIPSGLQNAAEFVIELLQGQIDSNMKRGAAFFNYIGTVFVFVLLSNLSGLFGLRPAMADFGVTFAIGLTTFVIIQVTGIREKKLGHFKALFEPVFLFFPINVVGEIANPISLSMRLFANLLAGTIIMALWYGLMPVLAQIGIPSFLHAYLDVFSGCIQAYVLFMLTMVYIDDKM